MKKRRIRSLVAVLIAALMFTMVMPLSASAASKNPAKVKITSFKVGKVSTATNKTTVTIKWKKASKATGYQIYEKNRNGVWIKLKTVKKSVRKLTVKKVPAGQYDIKVRAIRKYKGKTYNGAFSAVKSKYIVSPLTFEQYVYRVEPSMKYLGGIGSFNQVTYAGNMMYYTYDMAKDSQFSGYSFNDLNTDYWKAQLINYINTECKSKFLYNKALFIRGTGIKGIHIRARATYNGAELTGITF